MNSARVANREYSYFTTEKGTHTHKSEGEIYQRRMKTKKLFQNNCRKPYHFNIWIEHIKESENVSQLNG